MNYAQPDACDAPPSELTEFAYDMAQSFVITHKDKDVRLLAACAIAEVLRICAPKPPYDDEQLKVCTLDVVHVVCMCSSIECIHFVYKSTSWTGQALICLLSEVLAIARGICVVFVKVIASQIMNFLESCTSTIICCAGQHA